MIFFFLGIAVGVAASLGYVPVLAHVIDRATTTAVTFGTNLTTTGVHHLSANHPSLASALGVCLGVALPGLLCLVLVVAAKFGVVLRRAAGGLLVVAGVAGFFFLPHQQAILVLGVSAALSALFMFTTGMFIVAPLGAIAGALAVSSVRVLLSGKDQAVNAGIATLTKLSGVNDPQVWKVTLVVLAWSGFVAAVLAALHPAKISS